MNIRERLDASSNDLLQPLGRIRIRKIDECLYARKQVLAPMLRLMSQRSDFFLSSFLLGDIPRDLRRPNDLAVDVLTGETVSETVIKLPCLRWRMVSKCSIRSPV